MDKTLLQQQLIRNYYFAEAMAFYEAYYSPVAEYITPAANPALLKSLELPGRKDDRPLTWVPIVFHCTTPDRLENIIATEALTPPISLTESPLGELDRMRLRTQKDDQIAIGFPRRFVQAHGAGSVLGVAHNPVLRELIKTNAELRDALGPFVDEGDLGAFDELRVPKPLPINGAVWILTTMKDDKGSPFLPHEDKFEAKWGKIAVSWWHRTHQMGLLKEWQYVRIERSSDNSIEKVTWVGEHYWKRRCLEPARLQVKMPAGRDFELAFPRRNSIAKEFLGPLTFLDVADLCRDLLREITGANPDLPYAMLQTA